MSGSNRRAVIGVIGASPILFSFGPIGAHDSVALAESWLAFNKDVKRLT